MKHTPMKLNIKVIGWLKRVINTMTKKLLIDIFKYWTLTHFGKVFLITWVFHLNTFLPRHQFSLDLTNKFPFPCINVTCVIFNVLYIALDSPTNTFSLTIMICMSEKNITCKAYTTLKKGRDSVFKKNFFHIYPLNLYRFWFVSSPMVTTT
jgi:hypothetical protein